VNIYVESNFVLELALTQEQHAVCEEILGLCEDGRARLVIPAYSLSEPYGNLVRRHNERKHLKLALDRELGQLARTAAYGPRIPELQAVAALLTSSTNEETLRLGSVCSRLMKVSEVIPLDQEVLSLAAECREDGFLSPQDSLIYASVLVHLRREDRQRSCFLNRDLGFGEPSLLAGLERHGCKLLPSFDHGHKYVRSHLARQG
jgi:predicted nucleic acid-binding protein